MSSNCIVTPSTTIAAGMDREATSRTGGAAVATEGVGAGSVPAVAMVRGSPYANETPEGVSFQAIVSPVNWPTGPIAPARASAASPCCWFS
jgi:hypothetical protein